MLDVDPPLGPMGFGEVLGSYCEGVSYDGRPDRLPPCPRHLRLTLGVDGEVEQGEADPILEERGLLE